ncbi:MAG: helix-turn-helix transcriptional regulator [Shimia sp.]|uniref:winged helix-turn-helix transcriptional regulator n=1 Tax=Shimia sp. TaxID=1954381 RepID=UPI003B8DA1E3
MEKTSSFTISRDEYDLKCATRQTFEILSDKWVPGLIYLLSRGSHRPGELLRRLDGLSKKMLTQTLRNLEQWGVVHRQVFDVIPPHVEYSLTPLGQTFVEPIALLHGWAQSHKTEVGEVFALQQAARRAKAAETTKG